MPSPNRAVQYGVIHLNPVFVQSNKPRRFRNTTIRFSGADIFWTVLVLVPSALLLLGIGFLLGLIPGVRDFLGWWLVLLAPFFSVFLGRLLSVKINPYSKTSGEGLFEFLSVFRENTIDTLIWKLRGQRIVYQTVESDATGRTKKVQAEVWMGTARFQHLSTAPNTLNGGIYLDFEPSTLPTNWPEKSRERRRRMDALRSALNH